MYIYRAYVQYMYSTYTGGVCTIHVHTQGVCTVHVLYRVCMYICTYTHKEYTVVHVHVHVHIQGVYVQYMYIYRGCIYNTCTHTGCMYSTCTYTCIYRAYTVCTLYLHVFACTWIHMRISCDWVMDPGLTSLVSTNTWKSKYTVAWGGDTSWDCWVLRPESALSWTCWLYSTCSRLQWAAWQVRGGQMGMVVSVLLPRDDSA